MNPDTFTHWTGFAGIAILAACWRQVVSFCSRIRSLVLVSATVQGDVASALSAYCLKHYRRSPIGDRFYRSGTAFVRPLNRMQEVGWERPPKQPLFLFDGWRPIILGGFSSYEGNPVTEEHIASVTVIRWATDIEALIVAALDEHNRRQGDSNQSGGRFQVRRCAGMGNRSVAHGNGLPGGSMDNRTYANAPTAINSNPSRDERFLKWTKDDIGPVKPDSPMDSIALPPDVLPAIEEFQRWQDSEKWFRSHLVPWRRGWLLHGKPGTGKTSLVRALGQMADMPIFSFDLSTLSNSEMAQCWREAQECAPCIALFEDVDAVFDGRTNVTGDQGGGLTFDCLLNCLSGVETADGVFVIVTTNNLDKLDDALKRPGRLDRIIELPPLPVDCLRQIAERILGEWPDEVAAVMETADQLTGAQMTELCVQRALERYWNPPKP